MIILEPGSVYPATGATRKNAQIWVYGIQNYNRRFNMDEVIQWCYNLSIRYTDRPIPSLNLCWIFCQEFPSKLGSKLKFAGISCASLVALNKTQVFQTFPKSQVFSWSSNHPPDVHWAGLWKRTMHFVTRLPPTKQGSKNVSTREAPVDETGLASHVTNTFLNRTCLSLMSCRWYLETWLCVIKQTISIKRCRISANSICTGTRLWLGFLSIYKSTFNAYAAQTAC